MSLHVRIAYAATSNISCSQHSCVLLKIISARIREFRCTFFEKTFNILCVVTGIIFFEPCLKCSQQRECAAVWVFCLIWPRCKYRSFHQQKKVLETKNAALHVFCRRTHHNLSGSVHTHKELHLSHKNSATFIVTYGTSFLCKCLMQHSIY